VLFLGLGVSFAPEKFSTDTFRSTAFKNIYIKKKLIMRIIKSKNYKVPTSI